MIGELGLKLKKKHISERPDLVLHICRNKPHSYNSSILGKQTKSEGN